MIAESLGTLGTLPIPVRPTYETAVHMNDEYYLIIHTDGHVEAKRHDAEGTPETQKRPGPATRR